MIEKELQEKNYVTINKENIDLFREFHEKITPNRKSGEDIEQYLQDHYDCNECEDLKLSEQLVDSMKDETSENVEIHIYQVGDLKVAINRTSGAFLVSGDDLDEKAKLWDELFLYRGLNEEELSNPFLVGTYIKIKGLDIEE